MDYTSLIKEVDIPELVKALRDKHIEDRYKRLTLDAAAAIEALEAEIRESMQKCAECSNLNISLV